jgi:hypothetical protein
MRMVLLHVIYSPERNQMITQQLQDLCVTYYIML